MGLSESYSGTRGQILLMNPLPSVRQAYASVAQEEKQCELASSVIVPSNVAAMVVRGNSNPRPNAIKGIGTRNLLNALIVEENFTGKQLVGRKMVTHQGTQNTMAARLQMVIETHIQEIMAARTATHIKEIMAKNLVTVGT